MPTNDGATANADGSFTIIDDGQTFNLSNNTITTNNRQSWISSTERGSSFVTDDVTAVGGLLNGEAFSGISGTLASAPSGNASFEGRYAVASAFSFNSGTLTLNYDLVANELTSAAGSDFTVDGDVSSSGAVTGTVAYNGETADFEGGFYGANDVAGAFNNTTIGGVFFGTN